MKIVHRFIHHISSYCRSKKHNRLTKRIAKKLKLNNDQQQQLMALSQQITNVIAETKRCNDRKHREIIELLNTDKPDKDKLKSAFQSRVDAFTQQGMEAINRYLLFFDSLGSDQQQMLRSQLQQCGHSPCCHC